MTKGCRKVLVFASTRRVETVLLFCFLLLTAWVFIPNRENDLEQLINSGELVVISRESPSTWYRDKNGQAGPEFDYVSSFAKYLDIDVRFETRENNQDALDALAEGEAQLAAIGVTRKISTDRQSFIFGPEYQQVDHQIVCRRDWGRLPKKIGDMAGRRLVVLADSSYEADLVSQQKFLPDLEWESVKNSSIDELLERVWRKDIDCTIANSGELNIKRRFYPELQAAFTLTENQSLAWALSKEWGILTDSINDWLSTIRKDGTLQALQEKHYQTDEFDYVDTRSFNRRIGSRLPALMPYLRKAADKYELPWTLLAAQAYQESNWNRKAKSPTGVRGVMMLTLVTAQEVGVKNRLNAEQSIMGGAKYLTRLEARIPESVEGQDRWWFALAAYNVGMGHLHDARRLAEDLEFNPDRWIDLKGTLPLLAQKQYYKTVKYGYARGAEPVTYVRRIRNYKNILEAQLSQILGPN